MIHQKNQTCWYLQSLFYSTSFTVCWEVTDKNRFNLSRDIFINGCWQQKPVQTIWSCTVVKSLLLTPSSSSLSFSPLILFFFLSPPLVLILHAFISSIPLTLFFIPRSSSSSSSLQAVNGEDFECQPGQWSSQEEFWLQLSYWPSSLSCVYVGCRYGYLTEHCTPTHPV